MIKRENEYDYYTVPVEMIPIVPKISEFKNSNDYYNALLKYNEQAKIYNKAITEKEKEFKHDLEEEYNTKNLSKKELNAIWKAAYKNGEEEGGYREIERWYQDLIENY